MASAIEGMDSQTGSPQPLEGKPCICRARCLCVKHADGACVAVSLHEDFEGQSGSLQQALPVETRQVLCNNMSPGVQLLLSRQQARPGATSHGKLQGDVLEACLTLLEDPEPRVRLAVSECMRLLAEQHGVAVWLQSRDAILESISACWVHPMPPTVIVPLVTASALFQRVTQLQGVWPERPLHSPRHLQFLAPLGRWWDRYDNMLWACVLRHRGSPLPVQDRDAILQGAASRTSPSAPVPDSTVPHTLQGAGCKPAAVHKGADSMPQLQPTFSATGTSDASGSNETSSSAGESALEKLGQMQIAAQQQSCEPTAASPAAAHSAAACAGLRDSNAAVHDSSLMEIDTVQGTGIQQTVSRPAQSHGMQAVPAQQDSRSAQSHGMHSRAAEQDSGPARGDFLADLLSSSYTRHAPGTGDMRHDTEGWRCLETSFKVTHLNWSTTHSFRPLCEMLSKHTDSSVVCTER